VIFRKNGHKNFVLKGFLISYLFILIIPILLTIPVYRQVVKVITEDTKESRLFMLQHTRELMDKYLSNMDGVVNQIGFSQNIDKVMRLGKIGDGSPEVYNIWEFSRYLSNIYSNDNVFEFPFIIYMRNSGVVFTNKETTFNFKDFYNTSLKYDNMTYDEWYNLFFKKVHFKTALSSQKVTYMGERKGYISYINTIPMLSKTNSCVVLFMIDNDTIDKLMSKYQVNKQGWYYIINKEGNLITKSSSEAPDLGNIKGKLINTDGYLDIRISNKDNILTYTNSGYNDWTYISVIPKNAIMAKVQYIKLIAEGVAAVTIIIGLIISYFLAYRNSRPFKEMIDTFTSLEQNNNSGINTDNSKKQYEFIKNNIDKLINNNKSMNDSLKRHSETLKNIFLDKILKGEFENKNKLDTLLTHAGLEIKGNSFIVATIKINRLDNLINRKILEQLDVLRIFIEEILYKYIDENGYPLILNENEMALILCFSNDDKDICNSEVKRILSSVRNEFEEKYQIIPAMGIGQIYNNLMDLHNSFREAKQAVEYSSNNTDGSNSMNWYENIKEINSCYFYPYDLELKLVNYTKSGNFKEIETAINTIYNENYILKVIPQNIEKYLFYDMRATIIKLMGENMTNVDLSCIEYDVCSKNGAVKIFSEIKVIYQNICKTINLNKKSHNKDMIFNMQAFIDSNYTDANLSVCTIASNFNISQSYFSQFFKEQTGDKFSNYLENLRIQYACRLIKESKYIIDEIAVKVGYNNARTFRRAFKKVTGVAPSSYS